MSTDTLINERSFTLRVLRWNVKYDRYTQQYTTTSFTVKTVPGLLPKLSIVLMLIAHPLSGKACLGRGSAMRGQTILLSPILQVTGNGVNTSYTPYQTTARWQPEQEKSQKNGKNTSQGGSQHNTLVCQGWHCQTRIAKGLDSKKNKTFVSVRKLKWPDSSSPQS